METELSILSKALGFAANKHKNQIRLDGKTPFINHPITVMQILSCDADIQDIETCVAAVLHDTIEDTDTSYDELVSCFGKSIADLVQEVTDDCALTYQERKSYQILHVTELSLKAKHIRLADKIANLRDLINSPPINWSYERRLRYCDWAEQVGMQIMDTHPILDTLFRKAVVDVRKTSEI